MEQLNVIRSFSFIIAVLITITSWQGLVSPEIYAKETAHWATQAMGQDLINLCIVPVYLLSAFLVTKNKNNFILVWVGITAYFIYTFFIYCFDIHFNALFLFYTLILGLCIYSLVFVLYANRKKIQTSKTDTVLKMYTGGYFILTATFFYLLWFSEIIPANLIGIAPHNLEKLPTNPVHVLDLSIVLPGILISGISLIRNKKVGNLLAPVILSFSMFMELTIGLLMLYLWKHGDEEHPQISLLLFSLAGINLVLLVFNLRNKKVLL